MNDDSAGMLTEGRFDSDVILSHTLEYTHTYNELLLIAGGGRGSRSRGVGLYSTVKNHIFFVDKAYSLRGMIIFSRE
ncbi:Uncharacterised protein [Citrobacter koseri]|uniref:Uncharacterized protein n=1 Tax=Citrobacter koseri TaxID=545 RepID=A0A447UG20_CITKO|nr:Uncharacterised protein [Citrobacter koseri]